MFKSIKKYFLFIAIVVIIFCGLWVSFNLGKKYTIKKIAELSMGQPIKFDEEIRSMIIKNTREQIENNSIIKENDYALVVKKIISNWIIFDIYPFNKNIDNASIYVEYKNGDIRFYGPATSFESLQGEHPELFE